MIIFVMGAEPSERSSLARMLAIVLDWEFANADELPLTYVHGLPLNRQCANRTRLEALSAALQYWVYNWHDVIVSCWELSAQERKLLGTNLPSVKFIYMRSPDRSFKDEFSGPQNIASINTPRQAEANERVLIIDPSRKTKEIIAKIIAVLVLNRRTQNVVAS